MTKTLIAIIARMGSSRLKDKHLKEVQGKPILAYLIERIKKEFNNEIETGSVKLVIATPDEIINQKFEQIFDIDVFYGSKTNIPFRLLQATNYFNAKNVIAVDGDDIFSSVKGMRKVFNELNTNDNGDYVSTTGLPLGMNITGFSESFLNKSLQMYNEQSILETGWGQIFNKQRLLEIAFSFDCPFEIRMTLDYYEDYLAFSSLINSVENIIQVSDEKLVETYIQKEFYKLNNSKIEEYWINFKKNKNNK